jgi:hypothetical protein
MAIINVNVESTQTTTLFTAPSEVAVTTMFFCNQSATTDCLVDIFLTPAGQAQSANTQIIKSLPLPKTETFVFDAEKLILEVGDKIHSIASVDKIVVATISYVVTG